MCCEICPRYVACEEEDHLNDLCCAGCPDNRSCQEENPAEVGESSDGFGEESE